MIRTICLFLCACSLLGQQVLPILPDSPHHPRPLPPPVQPQLRTTALDILVQIREGRAETEWRQKIHNFGAGLGQADWIFALPRGADMTQFALEVDGKSLTAELLDADKAEKLYLEIVRKRQDPGLLQLLGSGAVRVRIFPIEAGADRIVTLKYGQILERDSGLMRYSLPLRAAAAPGEPISDFSLQIEVEAEKGIKTLFSPTHELNSQSRSANRARLEWLARSFAAERDFELLFSSGGEALDMEVTHYREGDQGYFLLAISPDWKSGPQVFAKDVAFVVDTSGSMQGPKLEQAKRALRNCIEALGPQDRFELIEFGTESRSLFSGWTPADSAARAKAKAHIEEMRAGGGTNLDEALAAARKLARDGSRAQLAMLLSDGLPTVGEQSEDGLARAFEDQDSHLRLFPFGIGNEVNSILLDRLARAGRGWRTYVGDQENIELKLSQLYDKIAAPVMTDLSLEGEGFEWDLVYPRPLPDLFRGATLTLVGRSKGTGKAKIRLSGKLAGQAKTLERSWSWNEGNREANYLPRLWAQRRIGYLLDQIRRSGDSQELRDEIRELAKQHRILTPYTSYLILEDEPQAQAQGGAGPVNTFPAGSPPTKPLESHANFKALQERSGASSIAASESVQDLSSNMSVRTYAAEPSAQHSKEAAQLPAYAAGKTFVQREGVWTEASLEPSAKSSRILVFLSSEYLAVIKKHKELAQIFALGKAVKFRFQGQIWEVKAEP